MSWDIAGLYIFLTVQLVAFAFAAGKLWQRVTNLEKSHFGHLKETAEEDLSGRVSTIEGRFVERNSH